jgi:predicted enzyme related to lactoylglutathione lyase
MAPAPHSKPVIHLELHTGDLPRATSFYYGLFGWRPEHVRSGDASYLALQMGNGLGGGVVECATPKPIWLPYVEVPEIGAATERARESGASVLLEPREGPAGYRSVVSAPASGEIALWQQKR